MATKLAMHLAKGDRIVTPHYGVMSVTFTAKRRGEDYQRIQGTTEQHGFKEIDIRRGEKVEIVL